VSARYIAEVSPPFGGRPVVVERSYLAELDAAIDMALGVACDNRGRELGAIGPVPSLSWGQPAPASRQVYAPRHDRWADRVGTLSPG
jgi:hypothetical protein